MSGADFMKTSDGETAYTGYTGKINSNSIIEISQQSPLLKGNK